MKGRDGAAPPDRMIGAEKAAHSTHVEATADVESTHGESIMAEQGHTPLISLVVPFYQEGEAIDRFFAGVMPVLDAIDGIRFEMVCVNDGSEGGALAQLVSFSACDPRVRVIDLTRSFGEEAALTAGLDEANGDAVIIIDSGLRVPPALIPEMIGRWRGGAQMVVSKPRGHDRDSFAKRAAVMGYCRAHHILAAVRPPQNAGGYRLMDRQVVNSQRRLADRRCFTAGLFGPGSRTVIVEYEWAERCAEQLKFSSRMLGHVALEGTACASTAPLRSVTYVGLTIAALAFLCGGFIVGRTMMAGDPVPGYASMISIMLFIGGAELIGAGVVRGYIGWLCDEPKEPPTYLVRRRYQAHGKATTLPVNGDDARFSHAARSESVGRCSASRMRIAGR
jgi:glycosyltransferase involved in cell wall biosynthesis